MKYDFCLYILETKNLIVLLSSLTYRECAIVAAKWRKRKDANYYAVVSDTNSLNKAINLAEFVDTAHLVGWQNKLPE